MSSNKGNSLHFIAGSDYYQQEQVKKILSGLDDCETETFSNEDFSQEFFFNFINSSPMFNENRAAVVKSAHKINNLAGIISNCKGCSEATVIFASEETKTDKELSTALKDAGFETVIEQKAGKYDLQSKVLQMFLSAGFKIDTATAKEINEIFEGDLRQISNEIEKLSMYFAYKKPNSSMEILNAVTARKQDNIFVFIDSYTAGRKKTCMMMLQNFINSDENLSILINLLFRRMKDVYLYINLRDQIKENRPWMLEKIKTGANVWKHDQLLKLFGLFAELDYKNKTGQISTENYLTNLIAAL
jgi:DNA polymerase-3 subunit delta